VLEPGWPRHLLTAGGTVSARLAQLCALSIPGLGVSGASVQLLAGPPHRVGVHATDTVAAGLEDLQQELGEGPAVDVVRSTGTVVEGDLAHGGEVRWPWFAPAAFGLGAGAVFAWPVRVGTTMLGVLETYRDTAGALPDDVLADGVVLADAAAIVLLDDPELRSGPALVWVIVDGSRFRPEVHQATGMLTVQLGLGPVDAFARLCGYAYTDGRPIALVARDVVARRLRLDDS
jgi:ANTAR domain-containing protein